MNGFKRITTAGLLVFGLICSANSFGNAEAEYNQWSLAYSNLGIYPTPAEIRAKCKALGLDASQANELIVVADGASAADTISAANNLREVYFKVANSALESRSKTTVKMAEKVLALLAEVNEEKKSRNVKKYPATEKKLKELMHFLPDRTDSEGNIEGVRRMINKMNSANAPLVEERAEFLREVDAYYETSKNEDFDTVEYTRALVARFNKYTGRLNAAMR